MPRGFDQPREEIEAGLDALEERHAYEDGVAARDAKISREACPYPQFDRILRAAWLRGYDYAIR